MKTFIGIDYHKRFSYGTIMTEAGAIVKQARFNNCPEAVTAFLADSCNHDSSAVLEAGYNSLVMHDWLKGQSDSRSKDQDRQDRFDDFSPFTSL